MPEALVLTPPKHPKRAPRSVGHVDTRSQAALDALTGFPAFCQYLRIESKEGQDHLDFWGTQQYLIDEIAEGLARGIRTFYVCKGRQQGISTALLALDLYWHLKYPRIQGDLITDTDSNRTLFRDTLDAMWKSLPRARSRRKVAHNRDMFSWKNRSRLMYQVAGVRKSDQSKASPIGQSRGLNFMHGTECGSWADEEQLERLMASLAEHHPYRLYVFESTARGYNLWYDMVMDAKHAVSIKVIFIGWWRKEINRVEPGSPQYETYWDGRLTGDERVKVQAVKKLYGVTVTPEQVAWWRYTHAERIKDPATMNQEHPWLLEDCFQATGTQFLSGGAIRNALESAKASHAAEWYAYTFGTTFDTTELHPAQPGHGQLQVWEEPYPGALYVLGADPAYGSSPASDRYVATLWRVDRNRLIQAAEFVTTMGAGYQFAWVLMHLCGAYGGDVLLVLELSGPGQGVWDEIQRMMYYGWGLSSANYQLQDVFNAIRHYLYRRTDSLTPNVVYQWKMGNNKPWLMNKFRDACERGGLVVRSEELAEEIKSLRQDGDQIEAHGRAKDDRAIAAALAVEGWLTMLVPEMAGLQEPGEPDPPTTVLGQSVVSFLANLRRAPEEEN